MRTQFAQYQRSKIGTDFAQYAQALMKAKGSLFEADVIAEESLPRTRVSKIIKAAVSAGSTTDAAWAAPLADYRAMSGEFLEALAPLTIIGKLPGFRRVPLNTRTLREDNGGSANWAGQAQPKPISAMSFDTVSLGAAKCVAICVFTDEVIKFMGPVNAALVRNSMLRTVARFLDAQFIDPAVAAVVDTSPPSVTNGITPVPSTGISVAEITADLAALVQAFIDAGNDLSSGAWIVHPRTALSLSTLRDAGGARAFPGISVLGGELLGLPALTSAAVPVSNTTGNPTIVCLIDPSRILLADSDLITLDASKNASLQMVTDPATGAQQLVSLWQSNLSAVRVERFVNWQRADDSAVALIDGVTY